MKVLRFIVLGSFGFTILLLIGAFVRGDISGNDTYYDTSFETAYENYECEPEYLPEEIPYEDIVESEEALMPYQEATSTPASEPAHSDTHQTAPMPKTPFANEELLGYWMDYPDAEQPNVMYFYEENGQLMYRYYSIVPGNSIGINIANEVTEWEYCTGIVNSMPNQGNVYCQCGTSDKVYVSFYYGFDGTDVMYHQEDGTAFYKVQ